MSPSFAYGKGGRLYRYYIAMALQVGRAPAFREDVIQRVSASAVEDFLVEEIARLTGNPNIDTAALADLFHRVELRAQETHLVLNGEAAFPGEHPDLALSALRRRLVDGEEAAAEWKGFRIRVVLRRRLQLRGGRTVLRGGDQGQRGRINPGMVQALRKGHQDLIALKASPFTPADDLVLASVPGTQHDRQVARLALMSPDLQLQILTGRQPEDLKLRQILKAPMPLAWVDQRGWFEALCRT